MLFTLCECTVQKQNTSCLSSFSLSFHQIHWTLSICSLSLLASSLHCFRKRQLSYIITHITFIGGVAIISVRNASSVAQQTICCYRFTMSLVLLRGRRAGCGITKQASRDRQERDNSAFGCSIYLEQPPPSLHPLSPHSIPVNHRPQGSQHTR